MYMMRTCSTDVFHEQPIISDILTDFFIYYTDFKGIELRLLAHLSEDPVLIEMFCSRGKEDIFTLLASEWYIRTSHCIIIHAVYSASSRTESSVFLNYLRNTDGMLINT